MTKPSVIRVVFEFYPMTGGGSITHIIDISKKINPYLDRQTLIAPNFGKKCESFDNTFGIPIIRAEYPKWLEFFKNFKIPIVPFILFGYSYNVIKVIQKIASKENTLIYVHGTLLGAIIINLLKMFNLNIPVIILQDSANLFKISKQSTLSTILSFILFTFAKPKCLLIVDDGMGIDEFIKVCKRYKIPYEIVYHAIDTEFFRPKESKKDSNFVILSNHRLNPFKRVDLAILGFKIFLELINGKDDVTLIIVGAGAENEKLVELVKKERLEKFVYFVGEKTIEEVKEYINNSDVIVGTSLKSNLNLSIQEAMACGKPIVVFDSGEIKNLIKHMKNGLLAKQGNIKDFAEKLKLLYENSELRTRLGDAARETIIKDRSWHMRLEKELELYQ